MAIKMVIINDNNNNHVLLLFCYYYYLNNVIKCFREYRDLNKLQGDIRKK